MRRAMDSPRTRAIVGLVAIVGVIVLFVVLKGGDGGQTDSGQIATITVKDGQPVGGVQKLTFTQPEAIRFKVDSDTADEVHFHGYDVGKDVEAGGSVSFDVPSTITGVFEVELENAVVPLAEITVNPG
jgi:hypothetical protein